MSYLIIELSCINHVKCTFYLVLLDASKSIKCINCDVGLYVLPFQAKRDELLEFAQGAVSGLKINADIARFSLFTWAGVHFCLSMFTCFKILNLYFLNSRLDNEITQLQQQINLMDALRATSTGNQDKKSQTTTEVGLSLKLLRLYNCGLSFLSIDKREHCHAMYL